MLWARAVVEILKFGGHSAIRTGHNIRIGNCAIRIGSSCTYIPLILMGLPFVWRGDRLIRDAIRMLFFVVVVSVANAARLYLMIVYLAKGMPWKYAHDLINHLTYGPIFILIVILWLKAMRRRLAKKSEVVPGKTLS
ncbi:MAG: hypothetical protein GWO26_30440 [Phycisphaerae bacterium]|nr:hypothetical protein [Phycisphaerae bacterium]